MEKEQKQQQDEVQLTGGLKDAAEDTASSAATGGEGGQQTPSDDQATPAAPIVRKVDYKHGAAAEKYGWWWGTGRRKTAVARVRIRPGTGVFKINKREISEHFKQLRDRDDVVAPLKDTDTFGKLDVHIRIHGGGYTGQAGAVLLGLSRALRVYDCTLEPILREKGRLTRDAREVERKKYGQPGARKRFQFSKR